MRSQVAALRAAGCERVFRDEGVSGKGAMLPGLTQALAALEPGDVLVVCRLDRLGRSLQDLISLVRELADEGKGFRSLDDNIDTEGASGRLVLHLMGALADLQNSMMSEHTRAGLDGARRRGQRLGRQELMSAEKIELAERLAAEGVVRRKIASACGVSMATLFRSLAKHRAGRQD